MLEVTGIIVAGGRSSRMGQDKALLQLGGVTVLERIAAVLGKVAGRVIVVTRDIQQYSGLGLETMADLYPGLGPLSGIHAGLSASTTEWGIVVACDMPFVQPEILRALLAHTTNGAAAKETTNEQRKQQVQGEQGSLAGDCLLPQPTEPALQAVIPTVEGRIHPLLGLYHRSVLPSAEQCLRSGRLRLIDWLNSLNVRYETAGEWPGASLDMWKQAVFNMNYPQDYQLIVKQLECIQDVPTMQKQRIERTRMNEEI
ncbi:molybdenum cofactor guanylyltransferase [Paenibacillus brasilensis]|uniref:Probable molybdenum cofactor guanylyltransferase n=1 Tax=Paenibacillus brasilensis TaxID=128574 RepID=A0ABU0KT71_9BACL|nr:molybdenum cofactor guanylyltransferase [Paenibacillus brasilensis]MDQ0492570.1 molybdopterin-guanine dinucleotide biosynthesis protein A [Paenibacillus brasilensis]